jgi:hypothetical protein
MGRHPRAPSKISAEVKDMLACCFEDVGGCEAFEQWVKSSPKRLDTFYTKMWIRLLPMKVGHKKTGYLSLAEVREVLAEHGLTLEHLLRLKQMEAEDGREASGSGLSLELVEKLVKMEAEEFKPNEHVRVD